MDELRQILQKIRRRYRWIDTAWMGQRTLCLPAAAMLLVQLLGRVLPLENLRLWTWLPLGVWLVVLPAFSLLRRFTLLSAARRADEDLGLYERLSSALELELAVNNPGQSFPAELVQAQRGDALVSARAIDPRRDLLFSWLRRPLITAAVLGLLTVLSIFIPNPMDDVLEQRRAVARAAAEQADRIEELQQQLAQNPSLTPEEQQELAHQLGELVTQLRANPGDLEQALADLARMEQELQARSDPNAAAQQANLENLAARLQALAGMQAEPDQEASAAASQALAELAEQISIMTPEQRQQTTAELGALSAQAALSGDAQLSQALSSLAQAVQANNENAVQSSSQQAQQALAQTGQQLSAQQAVQQALQQMQQSRQALAQAGQNPAQANANSGQNAGPGQNPGDGGSPGSSLGSLPGTQPGSSPGSGQVAGGGGSQANTLPPANSSGQAGRPQGSRPGSSGELGEQVYAPWLRPAANGEELFIPGQDSNQGQTSSSEGSSPTLGAGSQALTPYYDVYTQYFNAANQAIQQSAIPASLADYIREYFSQLEP